MNGDSCVEHQRYPTGGDSLIKPDGLHITVSRMSDRRYEFLVAMHEVIEAFLCKTRGVTQQRVNGFDTGPGKDLDEPGDDPQAPYFHEHQFSSKIEKVMAHELSKLGCVQ